MHGMAFIQTDTFPIRGYECDASGRLSIPALMNFMQESANRNALAYGIGISDLTRHQLGWMLMRFRLRMHHYPRYGQAIRVITYPTFVEKQFIYRDFRVLADDDTLLADASSTWLVFSTETRTMVSLPDFIRRLAVPEGISPLPRLPLKADFQRKPFVAEQQTDVEVGWCSIDQNQHVNNVAYVQWLLEGTDNKTLETRELAEIDLVYRTESHWGDRLLIQSVNEPENTIRHRIEHGTTQKEVMLAQSRWK